ncbi:formate dehydrogenase subunit gamma [Azohydromonas sediminis]|uniref:formate dehydrogenase subunit gamma n=1 Tax=Azohydromonas sediminis TaxID=2259674 RepID=UPI000E65361C|nr:formate dehydrogenase subunit gamma [Azohydromonas sediminis]
MQASIRTLILTVGLALSALAGAQQAPAAGGPPAGFVAPADPRPDESNAERAKSQPGNNAPFWRAVRESGEQAGYTSLPGAEKGVLIQSFVQYPGSRYTTAGEAWRQVRNDWILPYGGALLLIAVLAVAMFYWRRGPMGGHEAQTGRLIERFTYFERAAHWTVAITFVILAVSGIVIAWGKYFLLPILGGTLFGWLTYALKNAHNFAGPVFAVALLVFIVGFIRDNIPRAHDLKWLGKGGGMFSGEHVPSGKFNAGEKIVFWGGVIVLGLIVVASGLVLDKVFPTLLTYDRGQMQVAHMIHASAAALMMAMFVGHIYMGTIGVKGAYQAMRTGYVDEGWAKEHHELWYEDIKAGRIPAKRSAEAAAGPVASAGAQG